MKKHITFLSLILIIISISCSSGADITNNSPSTPTDQNPPTIPEQPDEKFLVDEVGNKAVESGYEEMKNFIRNFLNADITPTIIASKNNSNAEYIKYRRALMQTEIGDGVYGDWVICGGFGTISKGDVTYVNIWNTDFHTEPFMAKLTNSDGVTSGYYLMDENYIYKLPKYMYQYYKTENGYMTVSVLDKGTNGTSITMILRNWKISYISK